MPIFARKDFLQFYEICPVFVNGWHLTVDDFQVTLSFKNSVKFSIVTASEVSLAQSIIQNLVWESPCLPFFFS